MALSQATRSLVLATPLGDDAIQLTAISGFEEMSRLFDFQLDMVSENCDIDPAQLVGKNVTFGVRKPDGDYRYFNGIVQSFSAGDQDKWDDREIRYYSAKVSPWLWMLTRTSDCRIFQEKNTIEIIEQIFGDLGFSDYEIKSGNGMTREYCVQYRETDFNFVSRLLEEEGMFYFFKHENGKHTMVIADKASAYEDCEESEVDYPEDYSTKAIDDHLTAWEHRYDFHTGKWARTDYDFKKPSTNLMTESQTKSKFPDTKSFECYDYPGLYLEVGEGRPQTDCRMEEEEADHDAVHATSKCKTFTVGGKFKVGQHRCDSEKGKKFVITSIRHSASETMAYQTGAAEGTDYTNSFTCIPDSTTFRPARMTPKPFVQGIQTAVVVGPSGEEIYTDEYGRIKVQFFWDREGQRDENSSCWMRVRQDVAGRNWGFMAIPRIGQEVIVDFLEGDADRPLVTGCVYNAEQMPAYDLPDEKTKTYVKTNSSKGGDGFNEIRFEDKAGEEQFFIHAQKDFDQRVREVLREYIGGSRNLIVAENQNEKVEGEKHLEVVGKQNEKIGGDFSLEVAGSEMKKVGGSASLDVGMDRDTKVGMKDAVEAGMEVHIKAGMKVIIEAGMQLSLKSAGGFIDIGPAGVTIQGTMVKINSGGAAGSGSGASPAGPRSTGSSRRSGRCRNRNEILRLTIRIRNGLAI